MEKALGIIKRWGVTGCLILALFWMNFRLDVLEERLYDCYEKRVLHVMQNNNIESTPLLAILPDKQKIKKA